MMFYESFNIYWILIFALLAIGVIVLAAVLISRASTKKSENSDFKTEQSSSEITENGENPASAKMMGFGEAIKTCFKKYFSFRGCATRAEYWWFHLFFVAGNGVLLILSMIATKSERFDAAFLVYVVTLLFSIAMILPSISVGVRRMHDTGNSGFFIAIPIANIINLFMSSLKSSEYRSEYNIHPTRNALGKAFVIFVYIMYIAYSVQMLRFMHALIQIRESAQSSYYDSDLQEDDGDDDFWLYDDEDDDSETVRSLVEEYFFDADRQKYIELVDEENGDLYFFGKTDLLVYPTLGNDLRFEHYEFAGDFSSLDDFDLDDDMDFRSFENSSYTALKSGKSIMLRKESGNYSKFTFKETLSAE